MQHKETICGCSRSFDRYKWNVSILYFSHITYCWVIACKCWIQQAIKVRVSNKSVFNVYCTNLKLNKTTIYRYLFYKVWHKVTGYTHFHLSHPGTQQNKEKQRIQKWIIINLSARQNTIWIDKTKDSHKIPCWNVNEFTRWREPFKNVRNPQLLVTWRVQNTSLPSMYIINLNIFLKALIGKSLEKIDNTGLEV